MALHDYLDAAIKTGKWKNDRAIALALKVQPSTVSRWRSGEKAPSAEEARALAELVGMPEGMVMAEAEAQRAKDAATRAAWLRVARMCQRQAGTLTTIALALVAFATYFFSGAEEALFIPVLATAQVDNLQIMALVGVTIWLMLVALQTRPRPPRRFPML